MALIMADTEECSRTIPADSTKYGDNVEIDMDKEVDECKKSSIDNEKPTSKTTDTELSNVTVLQIKPTSTRNENVKVEGNGVSGIKEMEDMKTAAERQKDVGYVKSKRCSDFSEVCRIALRLLNFVLRILDGMLTCAMVVLLLDDD